jgi:hypothetical protein
MGQKSRKWIITVIWVLGVILSVVWFQGQIEIDSCLDNGGRWNYEQKNCEYQPPQKER